MLILGLGQHVLHALHFLGLLDFKLSGGLLPVFIISCLASSTAIDLLLLEELCSLPLSNSA